MLGDFKPIAKMDESEALAICKALGQEALTTNNLDVLFGSNGLTGVHAKGTYSLLARVTGLSRSFIGRMFKGRVAASEHTLILLESVTGIDRGLISRYMQDKREQRERYKQRTAA